MAFATVTKKVLCACRQVQQNKSSPNKIIHRCWHVSNMNGCNLVRKERKMALQHTLSALRLIDHKTINHQERTPYMCTAVFYITESRCQRIGRAIKIIICNHHNCAPIKRKNTKCEESNFLV